MVGSLLKMKVLHTFNLRDLRANLPWEMALGHYAPSAHFPAFQRIFFPANLPSRGATARSLRVVIS
jgi:hypothetical protein